MSGLTAESEFLKTSPSKTQILQMACIQELMGKNVFLVLEMDVVNLL